MERIHMNIYKEIIYRNRAGESERMCRDLGISRPTVHKYKIRARQEGYLDPEREPSGVKNWRKIRAYAETTQDTQQPREPSRIVRKYLDQGLEMTVIYQRLRENHGYGGSYSSVRRFVHQMKPGSQEVYIRMNRTWGKKCKWILDLSGPYLIPKAEDERRVCFCGYPGVQPPSICGDRIGSKGEYVDPTSPASFASFGGVPRKVVLDNLKAAVVKAMVIDPVN